MAAPGKPSRWGSLLFQAVAGVESRLDNMLADGNEAAAPQAARSRPPPPVNPPSPAGRTNYRLQDRLARAMAGKDAASPRNSVDQASRPSTECMSTDDRDAAPAPADTARDGPMPPGLPPQDALTDDATSARSPSPKPAAPASQQPAPPHHLTDESDETTQRQQEETQEYVERIDSLQASIQYLSQSVESAKQAAASAPAGSLERKLAEKGEKIALLLEKGQNLSATEKKLRLIIKKLRLQITNDEKQLHELRDAKEKAASDAESLRSRLNGIEGDERNQEETSRAVAALHKEVDNLKRENMKKDEACRRLEQDARLKVEHADAASAERLAKVLTAEREKKKELEDKAAALQSDYESCADKARRDAIEWGEKLKRAAERGRIVQQELQLELRSMEGKLEAMRSAAEEASSGSGGEAQVNTLRQIETLQSQYASARENWQGIESSLLAKAASLERERNEAQRRESEMRKRGRDAASRCRHLKDELQLVQPALDAARQKLEDCRQQLAASDSSRKAAEEALEQARADLDKEKQRAVASRDDAAEVERRHWADDVAGATFRGHQSRPDSPLLAVSRTFSSEPVGLPGNGKLRRVPKPVASIPDSPADLVSSMRRLPSQPPMRLSAASTVASGPALPAPFSPFETPSEPPQMPSPTTERKSGVGDTAPSSPRNLAQDMISASTLAAGPSVQLVERMSAAIRRLEAEKVAARKEMARVYNQRDEARADMVGLMKDLEEAKTAAGKVPQLQEAIADLDSRYQTTLEMLGEKSELVEELKADVHDVKIMYRELVERTVK